MAAALIKFFYAIVVLSLLAREITGQCSISNIKVSQTKISESTYNVTVTNDCICTQQNVALNCKGFDEALKTVQPPIVALNGVLCLITSNGGVLHGNDSVNFTYQWNNNDSVKSFDFTAVSSQISCS